MSDNWLYLIPDAPDHVPDRKAADAASALLKSFLPAADKVEAKVSDKPVFVEPGASLEYVACPQCGQNAGKWWGEALETYRAEGNFRIITPCCGKHASLDQLYFKPTAGFARFVLSAHNPARALTRQEREQLSKSVGCNLREVSPAP